MKRFIGLTFILLVIQQVCLAQSVPLDIMATTVTQSSLDSVSLKVTVPDGLQSSELTFPVSEEEGGEIFITGTPYDSIQVSLPSDTLVLNQHGEQAQLKDLQIMYGVSDQISAMEVVSPSGCATFQIPDTGRIYIRLGGRVVSDNNLSGIYTGSISFGCNKDS